MLKQVNITQKIYLSQLTAIRNRFNYNKGWIAHKFKDKFGEYPPWGLVVHPVKPPEGMVQDLKPSKKGYELDLKKAREHAETEAALGELASCDQGQIKPPERGKKERQVKPYFKPYLGVGS